MAICHVDISFFSIHGAPWRHCGRNRKLREVSLGSIVIAIEHAGRVCWLRFAGSCSASERISRIQPRRPRLALQLLECTLARRLVWTPAHQLVPWRKRSPL